MATNSDLSFFRTQAEWAALLISYIVAQNVDTNPNVEGTVWYAWAQANGGALAGLSQDMYRQSNNVFPPQAFGSFSDQFLSAFAMAPRIASIFSGGNAILSAEIEDLGVIIPATTEMTNSVTGQTYIVSSDTAIPIEDTSTLIPFFCNTSGSGNQPPIGSTMTLTAAVGPISSLLVSSSFDGQAQETTSQVNVRLQQAFSNPRGGGTTGDYIFYASQVPNVTAVLVFPAFDVNYNMINITVMSGGADYDTVLLSPGVYYSRTANASTVTAATNYILAFTLIGDSVQVTTSETWLIQDPLPDNPDGPDNNINVSVTLVTGMSLSTVIETLGLTVEELIQREVRRAIISATFGGTEINSIRYILLADIERTLDNGLNVATGIYAGILVNRSVQYNETNSDITVPYSSMLVDPDNDRNFLTYDVSYDNILVTQVS